MKKIKIKKNKMSAGEKKLLETSMKTRNIIICLTEKLREGKQQQKYEGQKNKDM